MRLTVVVANSLLVLAACGSDAPELTAPAQTEPAATPPAPSIAVLETAVPRNPLNDAYFGELHLHTAYSLDAYIFGNTMNDPFLAYRFAKGEQVDLPTGVPKQIRTPLDFAAIVQQEK